MGGFPLVTLVGGLGAATGAVFLYLFLTDARLGLTSDLAYRVVIGVLVFSAAWYVIARFARRSRGIDVSYAFREIPPE